MKIYIASSVKYISQVREIAKHLKGSDYSLSQNKHQITRSWWNDYQMPQNASEMSDQEFYNSKMRTICELDLLAIKEADIVLVVTNLIKPVQMNGAFVEIGYAYALGKPVFVIGKLPKSAMFAKVIPITNFSGFLENLGASGDQY